MPNWNPRKRSQPRAHGQLGAKCEHQQEAHLELPRLRIWQRGALLPRPFLRSLLLPFTLSVFVLAILAMSAAVFSSYDQYSDFSAPSLRARTGRGDKYPISTPYLLPPVPLRSIQLFTSLFYGIVLMCTPNTHFHGFCSTFLGLATLRGSISHFLSHRLIPTRNLLCITLYQPV